MANPESSDPVGDGEYVVQQGDCLSSIAFENGLLPETIWNDPGNAALKAGRKDPNILFPGDQVHIPDIRVREESCATDSQHQFVLKGASELLRIVLLDSDGNPRSSLRYTVKIKGQPSKSGTTGGDGIIEAPILPNSRDGELTVHGENGTEKYELDLGAIDPVSTVSGVQARLNNLGFPCGNVDGILGPKTANALRKFQDSQNLPANGEVDDKTRNELFNQHGF